MPFWHLLRPASAFAPFLPGRLLLGFLAPGGTGVPVGMLERLSFVLSRLEDNAVLDAAIVANAQAVEHSEMRRYGTLIAWAEELGRDEIVQFLTTNLNEEKAANTKLNNGGAAQGCQRKGIYDGLICTLDPERLRDIAGPLAFSGFRAERHLRRTYQASTETISQASDAPMNAAEMLLFTVNEKAIANASRPSEPSAAPAASRAAAFGPRRTPDRPASRLRRISCFSISVALARKMAGSARNNPPTDAPKPLLIRPARTVAAPPNAKRMRYSYQRPSRSVDGERRIGVMSVHPSA